VHLTASADQGSAGSEGEPLRKQRGGSLLVSGGLGGPRRRAPLSRLQLPAPDSPGIGAAAGVVNQADDKRIRLSGYFTTPGLHHTTRIAPRPASGVLAALPEHP